MDKVGHSLHNYFDNPGISVADPHRDNGIDRFLAQIIKFL
jgi:hypothetical protein